MTTFLDVLPARNGGAAENMAADFLLLKRYPSEAGGTGSLECGGRGRSPATPLVKPVASLETGAGEIRKSLKAVSPVAVAPSATALQKSGRAGRARFRHYGWHRPAFTFGYSQKIDFARAQLPADDGDGGARMELCRRPTSGGVVDHRDDWAYALVIPREHALCEAPAPESYRVVHECIAGALGALGERVVLKKETAGESPPSDTSHTSDTSNTSNPTPAPAPAPDFEHAELHDVVRADTGAKIAGAAQKRAKEGLLFQGSLARGAVSRELDWDAFEAGFVERLAKALGAEAVERPWPDFAEHEVEGLVEQYSSEEWNGFR